MKDTGDHRLSANLRGGVLMIIAMALLALEDVLIKAAADTLPLAQLLVLVGSGGLLIFVVVALIKLDTVFTIDVLSRPMRTRMCFEVIGRPFYALALVMIPLSQATVILQATPLVVVAGAAVIFRDPVGLRRWIAIAVGLIGVIIILQPITSSFATLTFLAIIGMHGFARRDLASRAAPASLKASVLGIFGFLSVIMAGFLLPPWQGIPFVTPVHTLYFGYLAPPWQV